VVVIGQKAIGALAIVVISMLGAGGSAVAETIYVRAGHVIDTDKGVVEGPKLLRIEDGRVAAILPDGSLPQAA
jgi:hypothetical protein